ncbi:MAG: dUTP diphosphatase [Patescibacteria group bacterium]|jgi:dUTP pyrophosphatase
MTGMRVNIKRVDSSLPMPEYQTSGAAAFDIYAREDIKIQPKELVRVPSNLIVETPKGFYLMVTLRSGTPKKKMGLVMPHGVGIIDSDYCGAEDEVLVQVLNTGDQILTIEKGERFAQGTFVRIGRADFREVGNVRAKTRGGFGSTG